MMYYIYGACFLVSIGALVYMISRNYNNVDMTVWSIAIIIPISLLGYTLQTRVETIGAAKVATSFLYLDSTVLLMLIFFAMLKSLNVKVKSWIYGLGYSVSFLHYLSILTCLDNGLYYATMTIEKTPLGMVPKVTDGPLKITHYIYLAAILLLMLVVPIVCIIKKKDCSKKSFFAYMFFSVAGIMLYVVEMATGIEFSLLPFLYVIGVFTFAIQYDNIHSHDMDSVVIDQKKEMSPRGYVAFNLKKELLCYNERAVEFVSELKGKRIDAVFEAKEKRLFEVFYDLINKYDKNDRGSGDFECGDITFRCYVTNFSMHTGGKPMGYLCELQDVTAEQGYMNLIKEYGQSMEKAVKEKTEHIRYIQQKVVLGMATIIENRDTNTGGHVRRTSDIVKILVDEMRRLNIGNLDDTHADEIIRSAPMHDLGKIAIDNAILNKPGKFTDEEYKIMKTHAAKSGEIVNEILAGVEEKHFVQTAYNLARFHHERWDGKGYPERLMQDEIPLEARIMAVADVYDALVSKRVYKEPMSFDVAANIMLEGMGSQFDPMMKPVFENCREQLEEYCSNNAD